MFLGLRSRMDALSFRKYDTYIFERICYVLSLAARYCFDVFHIYTGDRSNQVFFRYAMKSVDIINRSYKNKKRNIHLSKSGIVDFKDMCKIFPGTRGKFTFSSMWLKTKNFKEIIN